MANLGKVTGHKNGKQTALVKWNSCLKSKYRAAKGTGFHVLLDPTPMLWVQYILTIMHVEQAVSIIIRG